MREIANENEYKNFILQVATKIKQTQIKLAVSVNSGLLHFYFELGQMISLKQQQAKWGSKFIENMAKDLKKEFPDLQGFSRTNLFYIKKFYEFYACELVQLPVGLIQSEENRIVQLNGGQLEEILFRVPWRYYMEVIKIKF